MSSPSLITKSLSLGLRSLTRLDRVNLVWLAQQTTGPRMLGLAILVVHQYLRSCIPPPRIELGHCPYERRALPLSYGGDPGLGFEPRISGSEPDGLPLNYPGLRYFVRAIVML